MAFSIPGFESAELAPAALLPGAGRSQLRGMVTRPAGLAGLILLTLLIAVGAVAPLLTGFDPAAVTGPSLAGPSGAHIMGTDAIGRDLFSGIVFGTRSSLLIAISVGLVSGICGLAIGMSAGFFGGAADDILMHVTEAFQVLPRFFLVAIVIALFGPGLDRLIIILGLTSWPVLARVVRGEVLPTKQLDYVLASVALGASRFHVFRYVLVPQVLPGALVLVGLIMGQVLLIEASLGFIGLGDPNVVTWGILAGRAQGLFRAGWWLAVFPGIAITSGVLAFNLTADALSSLVQGGRDTASPSSST